MKAPLKLLIPAMALLLATQGASGQEPRLYNPYERPKNGPPLTRIFHKVEPQWLLTKLRSPKHHPSARMPDVRLSEDEALDIMAYLKRVAGAPLPRIQWPPSAAGQVVERGRAAWSKARCTICHTISAPGDRLVGGFVDLRVGGIDLQIAGAKLKRDWLYAWIKEPKNYFPDTLMPRYRFSDDEIQSLVEYILSDDAFLSSTDPREPVEPERWAALDVPERASRGKRLIVMSRCVICHDIKDIPEVFRRSTHEPPPAPGTFEFLAYDLRCLSCHSIEERGGTYAPNLTGGGSRLHEDWIAQFVQTPDIIRPLLQQMPRFNLTAQEARLVAAYLNRSRRDVRIPGDLPGGPVTSREVQRGREVFNARGCISCHNIGKGPGGTVGPALAAVGDRLKSGYIWFHLKYPNRSIPYSAEPDYGLSDEEATALAAYLSGRKP